MPFMVANDAHGSSMMLHCAIRCNIVSVTPTRQPHLLVGEAMLQRYCHERRLWFLRYTEVDVA
jgi:hypothetical protein